MNTFKNLFCWVIGSLIAGTSVLILIALIHYTFNYNDYVIQYNLTINQQFYMFINILCLALISTILFLFGIKLISIFLNKEDKP